MREQLPPATLDRASEKRLRPRASRSSAPKRSEPWALEPEGLRDSKIR